MTPCNITFYEKLSVAQIVMTVSLFIEPDPLYFRKGREICSLGDQLLLPLNKICFIWHIVWLLYIRLRPLATP